jgi:hypothetical protein
MVSSCEQATHSGGCGFCRGFGMTLRSGKSKCSPWYSQASLQNIGSRARTASSHTARLSRNRTVEGVQLGRGRRLAEAELDPPVRHQVKRGDPFGHPRRVVGGQLDDAVTQADPRGPLARRAEEHLGRRAVGVLLQEVVLDLPRVVVAEAVGQLDLIEAVVSAGGTRRPRSTAAAAGARRRRRTVLHDLPGERYRLRRHGGGGDQRGPARHRARERLVERPPSWYFDLGLISRYVESRAGRTYHHTAPVAMIFALHAGLGALLDEGLIESWARHESCGRLLQDGLEKLGLELVAPPQCRLPQLTTVRVPDDLPTGASEADVRTALLERFGIEIGAGVGPMAGTVWRIGCMGHTARPRNVELLLGALGQLLGR